MGVFITSVKQVKKKCSQKENATLSVKQTERLDIKQTKHNTTRDLQTCDLMPVTCKTKKRKDTIKLVKQIKQVQATEQMNKQVQATIKFKAQSSLSHITNE